MSANGLSRVTSRPGRATSRLRGGRFRARTRNSASSAILDAVVDRGSWTSWTWRSPAEDPLRFDDRLPSRLVPYRDQVARLRRADPNAEAVACGEARIAGHPVAMIVCDFAFMGGTMGIAVADCVEATFDRALAQNLPVVAVVASAGVRMQEGALALLQMARTGEAAMRFRRSGRGYFVYLTHPSMGGVLASWGGLGTMTFGMPGACIGITGPRVIELTTGKEYSSTIPETAEHWLRHGLVDGVVTPPELHERLATLLGVLVRPDMVTRPYGGVVPPGARAREPWEAVLETRERSYPCGRELLEELVSDSTPIRGDGSGADDPNLRCLVGRVCGTSAVVVAHERWEDGRLARVTAAGYRKARRAIAIASELKLPIVTLIDTPGPDDTGGEGGAALAYEVARTTQTLVSAPVPTIALLVGEGGGGAALALLPADRVVAAPGAWLAPIAPEAASAILFGDTRSAAELAAAQRIAAHELAAIGIVDAVVPDPATDGDPMEPWRRTVASELAAITRLGTSARIERRLARCRLEGRRSAE